MVIAGILFRSPCPFLDRITDTTRTSHRVRKCQYRIRRFAFSDWLRHEVINWDGITRRAATKSFLLYVSGRYFISITAHFVVDFLTDPGSRFRKCCARTAAKPISGISFAFATFCVDGMKFPLSLLSKLVPLVDGVWGLWGGSSSALAGGVVVCRTGHALFRA